jgi:hypothetical protein
MAGASPDAIDFVQTYDDYPVVVMLQFEDLGFCAKGEGPSSSARDTLTHDGDFPNNTSGGQLSAGQAGCAGGFLGMTEAIRQLTDDAGRARGDGARSSASSPASAWSPTTGACARRCHPGPLVVSDRHRRRRRDDAADEAAPEEPGAAHAADEPAAVRRAAAPRSA